MTTSDKTGEKLFTSIRRTKTSTAAGGDLAATATPSTSQTAGGETAADKAVTVASEKVMSRDTYQSPGRVWPD